MVKKIVNRSNLIYLIILMFSTLYSSNFENGDIYANINRISETNSKSILYLEQQVLTNDKLEANITNDSTLVVINNNIDKNNRINFGINFNRDPFTASQDIPDYNIFTTSALISYDYTLQHDYKFGVNFVYSFLQTFYNNVDYTRNNFYISDDNSKNFANSYSGAIYFKYNTILPYIGVFEAQIIANYSFFTNNMDRVSLEDNSKNSANFNSGVFSTFIYMKSRYNINEFFSLIPIITFTYSYVTHDDINETGQNPIRVDSNSAHSILPAVDLITKFKYSDFSIAISNGFAYQAGNIYFKSESIVDAGNTSRYLSPNDLFNGKNSVNKNFNYRLDAKIEYKNVIADHLNIYLEYKYENRYNYMDYDLGFVFTF